MSSTMAPPAKRAKPGETASLAKAGEKVVLGLLTGVSYQSGIDYYKTINERFMELTPKGRLMPPNPDLVLVSVDCDEYAGMLAIDKDWAGVSRYIARGVARLVKADVDCLVICSNTAHIAVPRIRELHPLLPVLHIADTTARAVRACGISHVGLLGTEPTMREDYLKLQLAKHGIECIVPERDEDMARIFSFIMDELGFGVFKESTRAFFVDQVLQLSARGAKGVIMGCTEIELLLRPQDTPSVPLFASARLHIDAAARVAAGLAHPSDFMPAADVMGTLEGSTSNQPVGPMPSVPRPTSHSAPPGLVAAGTPPGRGT
jgi:aspartate racemase